MPYEDTLITNLYTPAQEPLIIRQSRVPTPQPTNYSTYSPLQYINRLPIQYSAYPLQYSAYPSSQYPAYSPQSRVPKPKPKSSSTPSVNTTPISYTIKVGDTLSSIAARFGKTVSELILGNPGLIAIKPGVTINIPSNKLPPSYYGQPSNKFWYQPYMMNPTMWKYTSDAPYPPGTDYIGRRRETFDIYNPLKYVYTVAEFAYMNQFPEYAEFLQKFYQPTKTRTGATVYTVADRDKPALIQWLADHAKLPSTGGGGGGGGGGSGGGGRSRHRPPRVNSPRTNNTPAPSPSYRVPAYSNGLLGLITWRM